MKLVYKVEGIFERPWSVYETPLENIKPSDPYERMLLAYLEMPDWQELRITSPNLGISRTFQKWTDDMRALAIGERWP